MSQPGPASAEEGLKALKERFVSNLPGTSTPEVVALVLCLCGCIVAGERGASRPRAATLQVVVAVTAACARWGLIPASSVPFT